MYSCPRRRNGDFTTVTFSSWKILTSRQSKLSRVTVLTFIFHLELWYSTTSKKWKKEREMKIFSELSLLLFACSRKPSVSFPRNFTCQNWQVASECNPSSIVYPLSWAMALVEKVELLRGDEDETNYKYIFMLLDNPLKSEFFIHFSHLFPWKNFQIQKEKFSWIFYEKIWKCCRMAWASNRSFSVHKITQSLRKFLRQEKIILQKRKITRRNRNLGEKITSCCRITSIVVSHEILNKMKIYLSN